MGGLICKCLHLSVIHSSLPTVTHSPTHPSSILPVICLPAEKRCSVVVPIQGESDEAKLQRLNVQ